MGFPELAGGRAVGRLDEDSEGLLVVTSLGWVQTVLTRPGQVEKIYWAQVERVPEPQALGQLAAGVDLSDGPTRPARARLLPDPQVAERAVPIRFRKSVATAWIELCIHEGRNRQVRRMTAAVGHPTLRLIRVAIGALQLGGLDVGESRPLRATEERWLQRIGGR